jgi:hypothetical protein
MQKTHRLLAAASIAALFSLSACQEPKTITANEANDPQAADLAKAPKVELPPTIVSTRTYRCKDNSLLYAEFLSNNTARVRSEQGGTPTTLTAADADTPYTAEGYSLSANATQVTYAAPGKGSQSCKA